MTLLGSVQTTSLLVVLIVYCPVLLVLFKKQIQRALLDELVPNGGNMTVLALVQKYVLQKTGVRPSTRAGYKTVINLLKKDTFGARRNCDMSPVFWTLD